MAAIESAVAKGVTIDGGFDHRIVPDRSWDTYLYIHDQACNRVAYDDDAGPWLHSREYYTAPASGTYYIKPTSYRYNQSGSYIVRVYPN